MQPGKLYLIISLPWKKYSDYFDKNCWGIWGLATILKYTLLAFFLFFVPAIFGWISFEESNTSADNYVTLYFLILMVMAIIWVIYLPVLCLILGKRAILKAIEIGRKFASYLSIEEKAPSDLTELSDFEIIMRGLKHDLDSFIYKLGGWITKYYPFSLMFRDRLFHPNNAKLDKFVIKLAKLARKNKVPIYVYGSEIDGNLYQLNAVFHDPVKRNSLKKLEAILQKLLGTVYVRRGKKKQIRILMPTEMMNLYITNK